MENGSPATPPADNTAPIDENQNELATEISQEDESALVDRVLGVSGPPKAITEFDATGQPTAPGAAKPAEAKNEPEATETEEQKTAREAKEAEDAKAVADQKAKDDEAAKAKAEEDAKNKPAEIPEVDTSDLWVEIEAIAVDEEGNQTPKTYKIEVDGELPEDLRFKNDKQLADYLEARREMRDIKKERETARETALAEAEEATKATNDRDATFASWDSEIETLIEAGELEAPKVKAGETGFLEDPSVQKIDSVFKFMQSENEKRLKDGKGPIANFTLAFNLYNKQESVKAAEEDDKKKAEEAKKRGAMVGGGSSASAGAGKETVYRSGSAKSIWAVPTDDL